LRRKKALEGGLVFSSVDAVVWLMEHMEDVDTEKSAVQVYYTTALKARHFLFHSFVGPFYFYTVFSIK
jgi:hypothetical protein